MLIFCTVNGGAISGISAYPVSVEADIGNGLPNFSMVGLLSSEVKESRERVRAAIRNSGFSLPAKRITINLSPADIRKEGSSFDLPIAAAILISLGLVKSKNLKESMLVGELSLDGTVKEVNGILNIVLMAKEIGIRRIFIPRANAEEGALVRDIEVIGVSSLSELVNNLNNPDSVSAVSRNQTFVPEAIKADPGIDLKEIRGQEVAKRAVEIAVAGMHNLLMVGPPGSGKSLIAHSMPTIFPELSYEEMIEITGIYSSLGLLGKKSTASSHPFRAPHHTITQQALVGGGRTPRAGEVTLAHKGILFLDELPEYARNVLETLRQPMEEHKVTINREKTSCEFPANFMLVAAMNPCPCGYHPDKSRCHCTQYAIRRYTDKISGPLLGRMDMCTYMNPVEINMLQTEELNEASEDIRQRIEKARWIQKKRYQETENVFNSRLRPSEIRKFCPVGEDVQKILTKYVKDKGCSARGYHKILKIARTIADLDGEKEIRREHIMEAAAYRNNMSKETGV